MSEIIVDPAAVSARVRRTTAQTIPDSTLTTVLFPTERWDPFNMHSTVTNTGRLTVPSGYGGDWGVSGSIVWASDATGTRALLVAEGVTAAALYSATQAPLSGVETAQSAPGILWRASVADYFYMAVVQTSGGDLDINAHAAYSPEFWAWLIRRV